jgi:3-phenylpropionate/cinnamic acid dioxygenase small subunit
VNEVEQLRTQLAALIDERDVVAVAVRYATALDNRDWDLLRSCFTDDVHADYGLASGTDLRGPDAIVDYMRPGIDILTGTQHYITNPVVSISGDRAESTCYVFAQHFLRGMEGGSKYLVGGIYDDSLVRCPDGWKIARRKVVGVWTSGNRAISYHARPDSP